MDWTFLFLNNLFHRNRSVMDWTLFNRKKANNGLNIYSFNRINNGLSIYLTGTYLINVWIFIYLTFILRMWFLWSMINLAFEAFSIIQTQTPVCKESVTMSDAVNCCMACRSAIRLALLACPAAMATYSYSTCMSKLRHGCAQMLNLVTSIYFNPCNGFPCLCPSVSLSHVKTSHWHTLIHPGVVPLPSEKSTTCWNKRLSFDLPW